VLSRLKLDREVSKWQFLKKSKPTPENVFPMRSDITIKKQLYRQRGPARYIYELYILKSKNFNGELKKLFLNENLKSGSTMIDFVNSDEDFETPPPVPHAQSR